MNPLLPVLMEKLAAEEPPSATDRVKSKLRRLGRKAKRSILGLGTGKVTRGELRTIKKQIRETRPRTEEEKRVDQLAGRKWTRGQYVRSAGIGAGMGTLAGIIGPKIEGAKIKPRGVGRAAAIGALYGAAIPAARRLADIEAAKAGVF